MAGNGSWPRARLGEFANVQGGFAYPSKEFRDDGVPVLKIKNVRFRDVDTTEVACVSQSLADETARYYVQHGDILISLTGSGPNQPNSMVGRVARFNGPGDSFLLNQRIGRFVVTQPTELDSQYLYYVLTDHAYQIELVHSATGSANQANISGSQISRLEIPLPPLSEQKAIAEILGALDAKIELNRRMNETLESLARSLFKSWFVDFDPVRAKLDSGTGVPPVKGPLRNQGRDAPATPPGLPPATAALFPDSFEHQNGSLVPKGWKLCAVSEAVEVNPIRRLRKGQIAPYLDMKNMPTRGHHPNEWIDRAFNSGTRFINGDTLLARITPCLENGKTAFVDFLGEDEVAWGSTEYIVLRPCPPLPLEFGYYLARSDELRLHAITNMTGSSGRQRVPANCLDQFLIAVPSAEVASAFSDVVKPSMTRIKANCDEARTLAALRDTLLPRLLSGELRVAAAAHAMEGAT